MLEALIAVSVLHFPFLIFYTCLAFSKKSKGYKKAILLPLLISYLVPVGCIIDCTQESSVFAFYHWIGLLLITPIIAWKIFFYDAKIPIGSFFLSVLAGFGVELVFLMSLVFYILRNWVFLPKSW